MIKEQLHITDILGTLGLKQVQQKVLLDIVGNGLSKVTDISSRLSLPKSSIYDALAVLVDKSLVNEYSDDRGKTFGVPDKEQLLRVHGDKIEELKKAQTSLLSFMESHHVETTVGRPRIKFYAGVLGIKQAFRDIPWTKEHKETYMVWPTKDMIAIDENFFRAHGTQRFKYGVVINAIELHTDRALQTKKHEWLKNDFKTNLVRVRYLGKGVKCPMSFWIYGNTCLFASSGTEKIAFTIHSKEFCTVMKLLWDSLWAQSRV